MLKKIAALTCLAASALSAAPLTDDIQKRLAELSEITNTPIEKLEAAVTQASLDQNVLDAISRPWEAKPWYQYAPIFLKPERVEGGVEFWKTHKQTLERAEQAYGVPVQMIVAIIGVETYFGKHKGKYPVLNALYTLGFHYPSRAAFFSKEFAHYVSLSQKQGWSLDEVHGSYAGAMGFGQFIPSSYLHYGVDFSGDGRVDMLKDPIDAIGSVANYFHQHKWRTDEPVVHQVTQTPKDVEALIGKSQLPEQTWASLSQAGVKIDGSIPANAEVVLQNLMEAEDQPGYWITRHNFYVITRYNRSPLYAMAVYQLSEQIRQAYEQD